MTTTTAQPRNAIHPLGIIWRSLIVGVGYLIFTLGAGMLNTLLGVKIDITNIPMDYTQILIGTALAGIVIGLTLGPLSTRLRVPLVDRAVALFLAIFMVSTVLSTVEAVFFTTFVTSANLAALPMQALTEALLALLIAWLFPPATVTETLWQAIRATLAERSALSWTWRFVVAGLLYVPTYLFFGSLIAPIVTPYYTSLGLPLKIPPFSVMLPLEAGRGLLFALALFPLVALLRGPRWRAAFWVGLTIAALGGWAPMLGGFFLPTTLRLVHGAEITADSFVQGLTLVWLLGVGAWRTRPARKPIAQAGKPV
ncbi:MAG: hypothetical protein U0822_04470 [Anaerolineae bacterium]